MPYLQMNGCTKSYLLPCPSFSFPQPDNVTLLEYIFVDYNRLEVCGRTKVAFGEIETVDGMLNCFFFIISRVLVLWRVHVTSLTTYMSAMRFLIEIIFILKVIKSHFKGSYDKQNLTLVVILINL